MKETGNPGGNPHRSELRNELGTFYLYSTKECTTIPLFQFQYDNNIRAEYSLILDADLIQTFLSDANVTDMIVMLLDNLWPCLHV